MIIDKNFFIVVIFLSLEFEVTSNRYYLLPPPLREPLLLELLLLLLPLKLPLLLLLLGLLLLRGAEYELLGRELLLGLELLFGRTYSELERD